MQNITNIDLLNKMKSGDALFILFGAANCTVCRSLRPQLTSMLEQQFPDIHAVYVDCQKSPDICAQYSVFSLPVVKVYIDEMKVAEEVRAFSIKQLVHAIERPYAMWKKSV